jgi:putative phosphoesterase
MRVAALYDVHGNLPALEAVLAEGDLAAADLVLVGGDTVTGPFPRETLAALRELGERVAFVRGNCDRLPGEFAASRLPSDELAFLAQLPTTISLDVDDLGATLFCHGSPRSDEEILTPLTPVERLGPILAGVREEVVVHGHTHVRYDRIVGERRVVDPGSVGMPYEDEPGAYWALFGPDVELRCTQYDLEAAVERIATSDYPDAEAWAREYVYAVNDPDEASRYFEEMAAAS